MNALRQEMREHAVTLHQPQHRGGIACREQLQGLGRDALAGEAGQQRRQPLDGGQRLRIGRRGAVMGVEAEEAQQAQHILADAGLGIADEAHPLGGEIGGPAEGIVQPPIRRAGHSVEGEIAPRRVFDPIVGEGDLGAPAVGLDIAAQGGDLEGLMLGDRRHRAMVDAGGHRLQPRGFQQLDHPRRLVRRGDVDVGHGTSEQSIAHAAADEAHLAAAGGQRRDHRHGRRRAHPGLRRQAQLAAARLRHGVCS